MIVTSAELLHDAVERRYAVGGFDTTCCPLTEAIVRAAEESQTPLLLMVPPFAFGQGYDDAFIRHMAQRCRETEVPIALHLDHSGSFDAIKRAIDYGFSSVMIDASALPWEENIALTRRVVDYAHEHGVSVEAEIGHVGGGEAALDPAVADAAGYTAPQDALRFAQATGVDLLAVAFGTVHGSFLTAPKLDLDRLRAIRSLLPGLPLVMHGGSGLSEADFRASVEAGINKVNIFTEISTLYTAEIARAWQTSGGKMHLHKALAPAEEAVVRCIRHLMELFGTPKASEFPKMKAF